MGLFTKDIKTMDDLFLHVLQDTYYAEEQILKALPNMVQKATNRDLTAAFKSHLEETERHVQRLEQAFELIGESPKGTACPAIDGIIKEARRSRETLPRRRCSMPRSSSQHKPSSTMRSADMERSSPGRNKPAKMRSRSFWPQL